MVLIFSAVDPVELQASKSRPQRSFCLEPICPAQPNRAQKRGQIPPNTRGEPINTPDTRPDTPDIAIFGIWSLGVSICVSAVAYFTDENSKTMVIRNALSVPSRFLPVRQRRYTATVLCKKKRKRAHRTSRTASTPLEGRTTCEPANGQQTVRNFTAPYDTARHRKAPYKHRTARKTQHKKTELRTNTLQRLFLDNRTSEMCMRPHFFCAGAVCPRCWAHGWCSRVNVILALSRSCLGDRRWGIALLVVH
jgi:hypothetical protein